MPKLATARSFVLIGSSNAFRCSNPNPSFKIEKMKPVHPDVKMDTFTRQEMFLTFIFAYDLAKSSIAGQHGFMPHRLNDSNVTADGNVIFGRLGSTRKLHMFGPEAEMNSSTLRNMAAGKCNGHTTVGLQNGFSPRVADLASGEIHCW